MESKVSRAAGITPSGPWLVGVGGVVAVTAFATLVAVHDDSRGELALGIFRPVVLAVRGANRWLLEPLPLITQIGGAIAALAIINGVLLWWRRRGAAGAGVAPLLLALGLALSAQLAVLNTMHAAGVILYVAAVTVVAVGHVVGGRNGAVSATVDSGAQPTYFEATVFLAIAIVAVFFRYYALNQILNIFEGELSPFMAGATSLQGILLANIGWQGPWAPMGILFYLPIWAMSAIAGSTVLAVRLGSAVISILTIVVVYVVVRNVIGKTAALWSAALLAVDTLQVGWGRSDMHPHASTAWPGVLLYGATVRALATGATGWYVAVMLLMALSWHQYPSGQFVIMVPVIAFGIHAAMNRGFIRANWRKGLFIFGGAGLWILGYPLAHFVAVGKAVGPLEYVARLGPRLLGGSDEVVYVGVPVRELIVTVVSRIWDLSLGLFSEAPHVFFQTIIPHLNGLNRRALPWFVVACAVVGLAVCLLRYREKWSVSLLALVAAGALPAVLSDAAWLKRASVMYLALIIVASVPLAVVTDGLSRLLDRRARWVGAGLLATAFLFWSSIWVQIWFSDRQFPYGVAAETVIFENLEEHLEPDTLLILSLWGDYIEGELVYLLSDTLSKQQPMALYVVDPDDEEWRTLLKRPSQVLEKIKSELWYWSWLGLTDDLAKVIKHRNWSRVVFLIEHRPGVNSDFELLEDRCPDLQVKGVFVGNDQEVRNGEIFKRYHVWIVRCDDHRDFRPPRFAVPAPP